MKIIIVLYLLFLLNINSAFCQFIKDNSIEILKLDSLDNEFFNVIKDYDLIMVGEMHGTNEPAQFVEGLAKLIIRNEEKVNVGIEIPKNAINTFQINPTIQTLESCKFFNQENIDGRNGQAWYRLISNLIKKPKINLFFFDIPNSTNRDSMMYVEVAKIKKNDKKVKIVLLSGNIHNQLTPYKGIVTMGTYLKRDSTLLLKDKIMSIRHRYRKGTMFNNFGDGLKVHEVNYKKNIFNKDVNYKKYFCPNFPELSKRYNFFIYTEEVTTSKKLKTKSTGDIK